MKFFKNLICKVFGHRFELLWINNCKYCERCWNEEKR